MSETKRKQRPSSVVQAEKNRIWGEVSPPFVRLRVEWCWMMPWKMRDKKGRRVRLPELRVGVSYCLRLSNRYSWMEVAKGLSKYFKAPFIAKEMQAKERRAQTKYYASLRDPDPAFYRSLSAKLSGRRPPRPVTDPPSDLGERLVRVPRKAPRCLYRNRAWGWCKREVAKEVWSEVDGVRAWRPVELVPRKHGGTAPDPEGEETKKEG